MAFEQITPEEAGVQGFEPVSPEEAMGSQIPEAERPGLVTRMVQRVLGTDVDDPLELERMGTIMTGAIGGSMIGSKTPIAPGPAGIVVNPVTGAALGGLAGVVAGSVAPEATLEAGEFFGLVAPGTRETRGLSNTELRRLVEGEALLELTTLGAATGVRAAGRFIGRSATGIRRQDEALAREASRIGVDLPPFALGDRGLGRGVINVLGRFPVIGGKARKVGEAAEASLRLAAEGAPSRIAPILAANTLGERIWKDASGLVKQVGRRFDEEYGSLFLRASDLGVSYKMGNTAEATRGVFEEIAKRKPPAQTAEGALRETAPGAARRLVESFLRREGYGSLSNQSLAQADELITKLDEFAAKTPKGLRRQVNRLLAPIRGAVKADIVQNGIGPDAKVVGETLASIDADFSATMAQLFETATARKFGTVQAGGLRATVAPSERATRVPVDKLADIVTDLDSPQVMNELSRLVSPQTYRQIASLKLGEIFDGAIRSGPNNTTVLNADRLGEALGVLGGASNQARFGAVNTMLRNAGSELTMEDLGLLVTAAQRLSDTPIPNWSTFVARRATLGGAGSLLRGIFPVAALTAGAGTAAGAATGSATSIIGGLAFFLGSRGLTSAVSNPLNARAIKEVLAEETSAVVKRAAWLRLVRAGANSLQELGEVSVETANRVFEDAQEAAGIFFPEEQETQ